MRIMFMTINRIRGSSNDNTDNQSSNNYNSKNNDENTNHDNCSVTREDIDDHINDNVNSSNQKTVIMIEIASILMVRIVRPYRDWFRARILVP